MLCVIDNSSWRMTRAGVALVTLNRPEGWTRGFDIMLTSRDVDAVEAQRIRLVSRTVPGVLQAGNRVDQPRTVEWTGRR